MSYQHVIFEVADRIATLTFNQPETRNAISDEAMIDEIVSVLSAIPARPDISVLIITGAGEAFSSGGNVKKMQAKEGLFGGSAMDIQQAYRLGIQRIPLALYELEVPVIAAVNGAAVGAGFDVAMMCDLRLASSNARFGETFLNLGIIPGDGGAWFLPRALGHQRAAELTFTGRLVDADEALRLGIVLEVLPPSDLMGHARELARQIAAKPPQALRLAKRLLRAGQAMDLKNFLDYCAALQAACHGTADHAEALAAFFEKRPGRYEGH
ncbi:crotonase/enoyl-CoA hydratase family protein [Immundisolibacter sp.]|uniref:crotonase/enoyl-CoA hydratase family protein n=1 Tax=Immundisolibacter sp. TaxID=1934948 RepID=UPI0026372C85|nr:crotonase/enoyl-CoA hydratase family protein [Immundisolibacter sp.]MDD3652275.1 crotonase/enoyl-CoA hydratase family protein [Immundisolibacter sp.]